MKRWTFNSFFLLSIFFYVLTACIPVKTESGELTGQVLIPYFMDDFSDKSNGWTLVNSSDAIVQYDSSKLRFYLPNDTEEQISTPGIPIKNSTIKVDAQYMTGPKNNFYGIVCRYKDARNYYGFLISSDGYYAIVKSIEGKRTILGSDTLQPAGIIYKDSTPNRIQASCNGRTLALTVNDQKLTEVQDIDLIFGDVGIIAGTLGEPGTDIAFDNFIVIKIE